MRTLLDGSLTRLPYSLVTIAEGTPWQTNVRDVRGDQRWATSTAGTLIRKPRLIVYHHTAGGAWGDLTPMEQLTAMELMRGDGRWGLPYNFIVFPHRRGKVWMLNDVDKAWPHTLGYNGAVAIAAWGNYDEIEPTAVLVARMLRLADALASMWGEWVEEWQHRDATPTACPGRYLAPLLPAYGRQRGLSADKLGPGDPGGS